MFIIMVTMVDQFISQETEEGWNILEPFLRSLAVSQLSHSLFGVSHFSRTVCQTSSAGPRSATPSGFPADERPCITAALE